MALDSQPNSLPTPASPFMMGANSGPNAPAPASPTTEPEQPDISSSSAAAGLSGNAPAVGNAAMEKQPPPPHVSVATHILDALARGALVPWVGRRPCWPGGSPAPPVLEGQAGYLEQERQKWLLKNFSGRRNSMRRNRRSNSSKIKSKNARSPRTLQPRCIWRRRLQGMPLFAIKLPRFLARSLHEAL
jgi:hypothetical protein